MSADVSGWLMRDFEGVWDQRASRMLSGVQHRQRRVRACVWLWWSEVSRPPPRACNWGFSSITPCPLTPLILSHPVADTFLSQTSARLFFSPMPSKTPHKLLHVSVCPPLPFISLFSLSNSPCLSLPSHLSPSPYALAQVSPIVVV